MNIFNTIHFQPIKKSMNVWCLAKEQAIRCGKNFNARKKMNENQVFKGETVPEFCNNSENKGGTDKSDHKEIINIDQEHMMWPSAW